MAGIYCSSFLSLHRKIVSAECDDMNYQRDWLGRMGTMEWIRRINLLKSMIQMRHKTKVKIGGFGRTRINDDHHDNANDNEWNLFQLFADCVAGKWPLCLANEAEEKFELEQEPKQKQKIEYMRHPAG